MSEVLSLCRQINSQWRFGWLLDSWRDSIQILSQFISLFIISLPSSYIFITFFLDSLPSWFKIGWEFGNLLWYKTMLRFLILMAFGNFVEDCKVEWTKKYLKNRWTQIFLYFISFSCWKIKSFHHMKLFFHIFPPVQKYLIHLIHKCHGLAS